MSTVAPLPADVQKRIDETVRRQQSEDSISMTAATTATPGPLRDVYAAVPDIEVGPFKVRRFTDRDFIWLANLDHPLKSFSALADRSYDFYPSGEKAWAICWLMTTPKDEVKSAFKLGVPHVRELAADKIGEFDLHGITGFMKAITRQLTIYASTHLEYEPKPQEGADAVPPSPS